MVVAEEVTVSLNEKQVTKEASFTWQIQLQTLVLGWQVITCCIFFHFLHRMLDVPCIMYNVDCF